MSSRQEVLTELITPIVDALGCQLWGIECLSQGRYTLIRVYIDKDSGLNIDDCEKVSRQISSIMDVEDPIAGQYTLEVSSPGMDRPLYTLEQFKRYIGEEVQVKLNRAFEKRKKIRGKLVDIEGDEIVLQLDDEQYILPIEWVEKAKLVPQF